VSEQSRAWPPAGSLSRLRVLRRVDVRGERRDLFADPVEVVGIGQSACRVR
jgi:hypothetical protein